MPESRAQIVDRLLQSTKTTKDNKSYKGALWKCAEELVDERRGN